MKIQKIIVLSILALGILSLTTAVYGLKVTANNQSFSKEVTGYKFKLQSLIKEGVGCKVNSARIAVWRVSDEYMKVKRILLDKKVKMEDLAIEYVDSYETKDKTYVEFKLYNASDVRTDEVFTIDQIGYTAGYKGYDFRVGHLTYGTSDCAVKRATIDIKRPNGDLIEREIYKGEKIIFDGFEIKLDDAYQVEGEPYVDLSFSEPTHCFDSDHGNNTKVKGMCVDNSGEHHDDCYLGQLIEYSCVNGECKVVARSCPTGTCVDGECQNTQTTTTTITISTTTTTTTTMETTTTTTTTMETTTTTSASSTSTTEEFCTGCKYNGTCYLSGVRFNGMYCSSDGFVKKQRPKGSACDKNRQCKSNICLNDKCVETTPKGTFETIIDLAKSFVDYLGKEIFG